MVLCTAQKTVAPTEEWGILRDVRFEASGQGERVSRPDSDTDDIVIDPRLSNRISMTHRVLSNDEDGIEIDARLTARSIAARPMLDDIDIHPSLTATSTAPRPVLDGIVIDLPLAYTTVNQPQSPSEDITIDARLISDSRGEVGGAGPDETSSDGQSMVDEMPTDTQLTSEGGWMVNRPRSDGMARDDISIDLRLLSGADSTVTTADDRNKDVPISYTKWHKHRELEHRTRHERLSVDSHSETMATAVDDTSEIATDVNTPFDEMPHHAANRFAISTSAAVDGVHHADNSAAHLQQCTSAKSDGCVAETRPTELDVQRHNNHDLRATTQATNVSY